MRDRSVVGVGMTSQRTRDRMVQRLRDQGIGSGLILDVMAETPRRLFVDEALSHKAYEDYSLPIGFNQTISQPYIVARMTEILMASGPRSRVLEIGTGSGYQTAVLAQVAGRVNSVERIGGLFEKARDRLKALGLRNVRLRHADGGIGWPDAGPYDGIIVTASPRFLADELLAQLGEGGRMVVPLGQPCGQVLTLVTRVDGELVTTVLEDVNFVPLLGGTE